MSNRLNNFSSLAKQYPYQGVIGKLKLAQYLVLRFLPISWSFPRMSIISFCEDYFWIDSLEEFRVRYYLTRIDFFKIWNSKQRDNIKDIESFYLEHDIDTWQQAFMSKYNYMYKKKILGIYHIVKECLVDKNLPVLDYGCGAGVLANYLHKKGFTDISVSDIESQTLNFVSKEMSAQFREIFTVGGFKKIDLQNDHYQVITVLDVLEHTVNPLSIVKSLVSSLKKGGFLVINFPTETNFSYAHTREAQIERPEVFGFLVENCDEINPEYVYRKK